MVDPQNPCPPGTSQIELGPGFIEDVMVDPQNPCPPGTSQIQLVPRFITKTPSVPDMNDTRKRTMPSCMNDGQRFTEQASKPGSSILGLGIIFPQSACLTPVITT